VTEDRHAAESFLRSKLDKLIQVLRNEEIEQQRKKEEIRKIAGPMFDYPLMAKLTLGKKHWFGLTEANKEAFTQLLIKQFEKTYFDKLTLYRDEEILFESPIEKGGKTRVPTHLISKDRKMSILYKLYQPENNWKIYDVEIQGVSIVRSYRSQFTHILKDGTIDDLLSEMQKSVET
jgi:phospholipid transport system substrate-binding protein